MLFLTHLHLTIAQKGVKSIFFGSRREVEAHKFDTGCRLLQDCEFQAVDIKRVALLRKCSETEMMYPASV